MGIELEMKIGLFNFNYKADSPSSNAKKCDGVEVSLPWPKILLSFEFNLIVFLFGFKILSIKNAILPS